MLAEVVGGVADVVAVVGYDRDRMSDVMFRTLHSLRIKGFAKADTVAELLGVEESTAERQLCELQQLGQAQFRESRSLWQLTEDGRAAHAAALAADLGLLDLAALAARYRPFLALDHQFKALCGDWQLRGGAPNDHTDQVYDRSVVDRLVALNDRIQVVLAAIAELRPRLAGYGPRLAETCQKVAAGETTMLTGVMCGSYHDVWMELHEDLILTLGIDRGMEGST